MSRMWITDITEGRRWLSTGMEAEDELDADARARLLAVAAQVAVLAMEAGDGVLARRAVAASEDRSGLWPSLAHSLLCLNAGIRGMITKDPACTLEVEQLGQQAVQRATEPLGLGLAWFWLGQARVLVDDLDGAIEALERGSIEAIPGGDMSPVSLAMLAGALHLADRHDDALAAADRGVRSSQVVQRHRAVGVGALLLAALRARAGSAGTARGGGGLHPRPASRTTARRGPPGS